MEQQLPHMQHYVGAIDPQLQQTGVDPQALSQQSMGQVDPQSMSQQIDHMGDNQSMSRNVELLPLSVPMDSHAMPVSIDHHSVARTMTSNTVSSAINTHPMTSAIDSHARPLDSQVMQGQQFMARTIDSHHQIIGSYNAECIDRQNIAGPMNHKHNEHHINLNSMQGHIDTKNIGNHSDLINISNSIEMQIQNQQHSRTIDVPHHLSGSDVIQHLGQHVQFQGHMESGMAPLQPQPVELVSNINTQRINSSATIQHQPIANVDNLSKQLPREALEQNQLTRTFQPEPVPTPTVVTSTVTQSISVSTTAINNLPQVCEKPAEKEYTQLVTRSSKDGADDNIDFNNEQSETDKTHDVSFYRKAMKSLCEKMSLAGEESMVLTATLSEGKVNKFGSKLGMMFLNGNNGMLDGFLTFCKDQFHAEVQQSVPDTSETTSVLEKKKRGRKKKEVFEEQPFTKIMKRNDKKSEEKTPVTTPTKIPDKPTRTSSRRKKPSRSLSPTPEIASKTIESDEDNSEFMDMGEMDDAGDSDYDVSKEISAVTDDEVKEESAEEDDKPVTRSKRRKLQTKPQKKTLKTTRKGQKLSAHISKLKMKISDKKKIKDNQSKEADEDDVGIDKECSDVTSKRGCKTKRTRMAEKKSQSVSRPVTPKAECQELRKTLTLARHSIQMSSGVKPYRCELCGKFFRTVNGRKTHLQQFHGKESQYDKKESKEDKAYQCQICKGLYGSPAALRKHEIRVHTKDDERLEKLEALVDFDEDGMLNQVNTDDSREKSTSEPNMEVHDSSVNVENSNSVNRDDEFKCDKCSKTFPTSRDLKNHQISHETGKETYECDQCKRVYQHPIALYRHKIMHTKSGKFTCKICGKQYATIAYLRKHSKLHRENPPFKCAYCQKTFNERRGLQYHLNIHTKQNPFMCELCGKAFPRPQQLRKHARIHSEDRPYKCDQCGKAFKQNDTLRAHKETHNPTQDFMCQTCGRTFNRAYNLRKHEKVHMESSFFCKECGKQCKSAASLKSHFISFHLKPEDVPNYKYSVWQCDICLKPFAERLDRDSHRRSHTGEKPYQCEHCDKAFADKSNLRAHIRNHFGEKTKTCYICSKSFTFNRDLKKHMKTHNDDRNKNIPGNSYEQLETPKPIHKSNTSICPPQSWTEAQQNVSSEALSAAYALTMARDPSLQPLSNTGTTEYTWQYM